MKSFGIQPNELQDIKKLFQQFLGDLDDAKAYLFGSRATGKHKKYSDIDIAVKSKSKNLSKKIEDLKEAWEKSNIPYKADISNWKDLYKPYLPKINKDKTLFWEPEEKQIHPWRICPYGQHWVVRHPRFPVGGKVQDVDGHCRKNRGKKDVIKGDEIQLIAKTSPFQDVKPLPCPYQGKDKIPNANDFDTLIAGWCKYWNDIFQPDIPIDPNFVKALMESESRFNPSALAQNKKEIGPARGLIQITEQTWRILKDRKGEIKDHYIDLKKEELFEPSKNISAAIRWLFRKREMLQKRLGKSPSWVETIVEYKGLGPQLKKNGPAAKKIMDDFNSFLQKYVC